MTPKYVKTGKNTAFIQIYRIGNLKHEQELKALNPQVPTTETVFCYSMENTGGCAVDVFTTPRTLFLLCSALRLSFARHIARLIP